jgi:hypothetical protein
LSERKVKATKDKLKKLVKWERPRTYKDLQRTLVFFLFEEVRCKLLKTHTKLTGFIERNKNEKSKKMGRRT